MLCYVCNSNTQGMFQNDSNKHSLLKAYKKVKLDYGLTKVDQQSSEGEIDQQEREKYMEGIEIIN